MAYSRQQLMGIADQAAAKYGVDAGIFKRQIGAESNWRTDATSSAGAQGIAQFMPATARGMGVNPNDPVSALDGAARYMSNNLKKFGGDYSLALAAYNAGGGAARKALASYPETQAYVKKILGGKDAPVGSATLGLGSPQGESEANINPYAAVLASGRLAERRPKLAAALARVQVAQPAKQAPSLGLGDSQLPSTVPMGKDYRWIQQQGMKLFGLRNDAGNSQTTGGKHTAGSEHYKNRAVDFGTALNTPAQLSAWKRWAVAQGLDALDEGDHIHVSMPGGGT